MSKRRSRRNTPLRSTQPLLRFLHAAFINKTIKTVERSVAPAKLKVLYVELPELERLIETIRPISSFLPRQPYGDIRTLGARDVLTASSPFSKNPESIRRFFCSSLRRADRTSTVFRISKINERRRGRPTAFGMYLAAMGEIAPTATIPKLSSSRLSFRT